MTDDVDRLRGLIQDIGDCPGFDLKGCLGSMLGRSAQVWRHKMRAPVQRGFEAAPLPACCASAMERDDGR